MSSSEKRYLHHCSLRSENNQRTRDKLFTLMKKSLLPAQSFFTRTSTGKLVYEPSSYLSQKRKSSRDLEIERIRILFERQKEQILAEVRSEIQKHEVQADSDRRSIQELTGIMDRQRMEIDHTITGCEQSRHDQSLLQEEVSEQNRDLRETRIRNMRHMEELQKSHVLKVEELSRRKLTEDFEEVISFSNVKTVYILDNNDAKYPYAEIDDEHTRNSLVHHCTFRREKQVRACCMLITRKRECLFQGEQ